MIDRKRGRAFTQVDAVYTALPYCFRMPDDEVMRVAADYIQQRGADAVPWLREQAELAEAAHHHETAEVWRELANAAEAILKLRAH